MVILAADVGNTDAVFGLIENGVILQSFRLKSKIPRTSDELDHFLKAYQKADRLVFCSVVPEWSELLQEYALQNGISILEVRHNIQLPFQFDYDSPETLGHDRIANAAAAVEIYGENIIVVDFGTAITFCSICNRMYKGGCIIPG
ncbi:MAG: type III pantothenate kinase, partial [Candidatus Hydrogenedentota bacterium]